VVNEWKVHNNITPKINKVGENLTKLCQKQFLLFFETRCIFRWQQFVFLVLLLQNGPKNVALYFCPYLCQLLTNFQNSFTGALCRQFAIMWLLCIPAHCKCVPTMCPIKRLTLWLSISPPNINRFSKFFHWCILRTISNKWLLNIPLNITCVTTLPCKI